jgi:transcriptional regulator with AAA-type ATPase domain
VRDEVVVGAPYVEVIASLSDDERATGLLRDGLRVVVEGQRESVSLIHAAHVDGRERWLRTSLATLPATAAGALLAQHYDVTLRYQAERRERVALGATSIGVAVEPARRRDALLAHLLESLAFGVALGWVRQEDRWMAADLWLGGERVAAPALPLGPVWERDARAAHTLRLTDAQRRGLGVLGPLATGLRTAIVVPVLLPDFPPRVYTLLGASSGMPEPELLTVLTSVLTGTAAPTVVTGALPSERAAGSSLLQRAAESESTVLLLGESGSGKTRLAHQLHKRSSRADRPFLDLNCAGLSPALLESELFGHERGAFTGAVQRKPGLLELAAGGTVFLDEIGELDPIVQAKLLKVLETRTFRRVGGQAELHADVRFIAATNRDLRTEVRAGRFREDLFYRLNVVEVRVPPLRERPAELLAIADEMLATLSKREQRAVTLSSDGRDALLAYAWPGNIRELANVLERAALEGEDSITAALLRSLFPAAFGRSASDAAPLGGSLDQHKREYILKVLAECDFNVRKACARMGVARSTIYEWMRREGVDLRSLRAEHGKRRT